MLDSGRRTHISLCGLVILLAIFLLGVDGEVSPAAALDRWVGTAILGGIPVGFTVLVNPGIGASWDWRYQGVQLASGSLAATVSGSSVKGTAFTTGGAIYQPGLCCAPCNFSGTIVGNRVDGAFDPVSCGGGGGTFFLLKQ